jgi:hypothetical protein
LPTENNKERNAKKTEEVDDDEVPKTNSEIKITPKDILGKTHCRYTEKDLLTK